MASPPAAAPPPNTKSPPEGSSSNSTSPPSPPADSSSTNLTPPPSPADSSSTISTPPPSPAASSPPPTSEPPPSSPSPATPPPKSSPSPPPSLSGGSSPPSPPSPPPPQTSPSPPSSSKPPPSSGDFLPPPPPKRPAKAPPSNASQAGDGKVDSNKSGGSDLNLPMVAGITAGIALFILIACIAACVCCRKKKNKRRPHNPMHYYTDSGPKDSDYYSSGPAPPNWHNGGHDAAINIPPPPGMAWHPPPPPPAMNSEISMNYSGSHGPSLQPPPSPSISLGFVKSTFSYEELAAVTNGFSHDNILGQGGFGYVYKGILSNGKEVAVKQLKTGSGQGEREFQAEVEIISRVHHRHLVSLVGYCIAGSQRLLVYEYVPNKTLEFHLHGKNQPTMDWPTRMRIALGSAKGLAYLHEDCHPRIIHRDIKASNILLDNRFEAMVADFGLAKLSSDNYTHVSTRVMGTFGYLAPEYASSGKLTEKSDVFSFGVMLLELVTGKRPVDSNPMEDSLVDWARPLLTQALTEEKFDELVDPRLEGNFNTMEMARMVACAAASVRHSAKRRPKMSQIVRALEGDSSLEDLNEGMKPGQSMLFNSSSDYDSGSYASNMSRLRRMTFESNELSQEYSGPTSDYGLNPSTSSSSGEMAAGGPRSHRGGLPPTAAKAN